MPRNLAITSVLLVYLTDFTAAGNTTCAGNMTQWYTDAVGETACEILPLFHHFLISPVQQVTRIKDSDKYATPLVCFSCYSEYKGNKI
jgi:hypothetical protein